MRNSDCHKAASLFKAYPAALILAAALGLGAVFPACRATAPEAGPGLAADKDHNVIEERFPGYQPKTTPDTVSDYRPGLSGRLAGLPPARLESLPQLIEEISRMQALALKTPGQWEDGSIPLGGDPREYRPSDEELLVSELGGRIALVVESKDPDAVRKVLEAAGVVERTVEYGRILFRHTDVMGSGRFFYATAPLASVIKLR